MRYKCNCLSFFAIQNSIIIGIVYFNYVGVSRYAVPLNLLNLTAVLLVATMLSNTIGAKYIKIVRFTSILFFQLINVLLLGCFALGIAFLGMPFEYEMVLAHLATPNEFMLNYGINNPSILLSALLTYIVCTSFYLSFGCKQCLPNLNVAKGLGVVIILLTLCLLPLSLSREPYLLAIFGHGFDGAPGDINKKLPWPKLNVTKKQLDRIDFRPIVLISIDAARGDTFNPNSPDLEFLYNLNRRGMIKSYEHSYSICSVTYCGILGILQSSYWNSLSANGPQLQDYLSSIGYRVNFLLSGDHSRYHGMRKMFGNNINQYLDGAMLNGNPNDDDNIIKLIEASNIDNKTFLYIHLMSMHAGGVLKDREILTRGYFSNENKSQENHAYKSRYQQAARQADGYIKSIFSILEKRGVLDNAIIIISADHGEMLGEKGFKGHSAKSFPFDPSIRIPLIVYDKRRNYPGRRIASQIDIAPTLIHAINGDIPTQWNGIPLQLKTKRCAIRSDTNSYLTYIGDIDGIRFKYVKYNRAEFAFNLTSDLSESSVLDSDNNIGRISQLLAECVDMRE